MKCQSIGIALIAIPLFFSWIATDTQQGDKQESNQENNSPNI